MAIDYVSRLPTARVLSYEGSAGLVTVGVMGAVFAVIYLWRRSLVAPIVMHFLQDFLSIVLLPLLGVK
jgi:membrane protease YdiL (CAAX protease family)